MKLLLSKGANVLSRTVMKESVLHLAVVHNHLSACAVLLDHICARGDEVEDDEAIGAPVAPAVGGSSEGHRTFESAKASGTKRKRQEVASIISAPDTSGITPLHLAVSFSRTEMGT